MSYIYCIQNYVFVIAPTPKNDIDFIIRTGERMFLRYSKYERMVLVAWLQPFPLLKRFLPVYRFVQTPFFRKKVYVYIVLISFIVLGKIEESAVAVGARTTDERWTVYLFVEVKTI